MTEWPFAICPFASSVSHMSIVTVPSMSVVPFMCSKPDQMRVFFPFDRMCAFIVLMNCRNASCSCSFRSGEPPTRYSSVPMWKSGASNSGIISSSSAFIRSIVFGFVTSM